MSWWGTAGCPRTEEESLTFPSTLRSPFCRERALPGVWRDWQLNTLVLSLINTFPFFLFAARFLRCGITPW